MRFKGFKSGLFAVGFAAAAVCLGAGKASAVGTDVNVYDGSGGSIASNVTEFDWNSSGAGVAIGVGPFGTPLAVNQTFSFLYQAPLTAFNDSGGNAIVPAAGFGTTYQFTVVASLTEKVSNISGNTVTFVPTAGTISIFYNDTADVGGLTLANTVAGTGFDDGTEIARFTATGGQSTFTIITSSTGQGSTVFEFLLSALSDFVDPNYIEGVLGAVVMDLEFQSTQNYPPNSASNAVAFHLGGSAFYPDYTVDTTCSGANTCDIVFKVDGSNTFSTIPEPGTLALWGMGLLGLGFLSRWRRAPSPARS
jgi:hypothetical protein